MRKNKGKPFENAVRTSFEKVEGVSIDRLKDASLVRKKSDKKEQQDTDKKLKGVDNPSDFIVYKKPYEVYVECKSHKGNTFPFSCIRQSQLDGMEQKSHIDGVKAGIILWFVNHDRTIWVPIQEVLRLINDNHKSINIKNIDTIEHIEIYGKKKRVYFDYDMKKFLEDLYGNITDT